MSTTEFILNDHELDLATIEKNGSIKQFGNTGQFVRSRAENLIIGAMAEIAVSKYLQVPWISNFSDETRISDVFGYQVKGTTSFPGGMFTNSATMPNGIYISCLITYPRTVKITGWSTTQNMWCEKYFNKRKTETPCYLVEPNDLWDMGDLPQTPAWCAYQWQNKQ